MENNSCVSAFFTSEMIEACEDIELCDLHNPFYDEHLYEICAMVEENINQRTQIGSGLRKKNEDDTGNAAKIARYEEPSTSSAGPSGMDSYDKVGVLRVGTGRRSRAPRLADIPRHSAVDVTNGAAGANGTKWSNDTGRLSTYPTTGDRTALLRSHAAKSAEIGPQSPRPRRAPRESRRVSLAQASGYVQLNQYRLLEPIGQGSYGIVKLAYNEEDDTHYAMKILSKRKLMRRAGLFGRAPPRLAGPGPPPDPLQRVYREIAVLKKLDHPNVVKLVEVLDDPAEDQLYLVFQLLEGGPVIDIPTDNPLSEDLARKYFRDALLGVEYLHYQRIAHRDIKPANLLLGEDRVQVADLGACGELAGRLSGAVGTPAFRAPEAAAPCDNYCGEAADIWSLGVTLYAMVTGRVPWTGSSSVELQQRVLTEPLTFPPRHQPSRQLQHLLARMLDKDPVKRATMKEIKEHPWITSDGQDPLPSEEENCRLVEVTEEDMARVVTSIPNLSTLILIKTMLKKHSFQNPFLRSRENSAARERERRESVAVRRGADRGGMLARAGRSLSAPGNYLTERQASFDVALESVEENRDQIQEPIKMIRDDSQSSSISSSPGQSSSSLGQSSSSLGQSSSSLTGKSNSENVNCERNAPQMNVTQHLNYNKLSKYQSVCETANCYTQNVYNDNIANKNSSNSDKSSSQSSQNSSQSCTNPFQNDTNCCQTNTNPFQSDTNSSQSGKYCCQSGTNPFRSDINSCQSEKSSCQSGKSSANVCQSQGSGPKSDER